jgi:magnesium chelatase family protein
MAMAMVLSRAQHGMDAPLVRVEVDVAGGLPTFAIVGLPEAVVKESKDRVRAAVSAPADLPKEGGRFDLPIAIGILLASSQLPLESLQGHELYGELSLSGELRGVKGALPAALAAARAGHALIVPPANGPEARLVSTCRVAAAQHLLSVAAHATGAEPLRFVAGRAAPVVANEELDLSEIRGQAHAKRALEIAAAGQHSLLLIGPPGTGKSMLAQRLPGLLPPLSEAEALEVAALRSILGIGLEIASWRKRPFRSPHHTASAVALVGGGTQPRPGEISLAHHGVLFLDELPEFGRRVLEVLREPLETGWVHVSRAASHVDFPAAFQLIAAMNPCPCGYLGDNYGRCRCSQEKVQRYRERLSGPLIDRLDMHVEVPRLEAPELLGQPQMSESSVSVAARVARAREMQSARQKLANARLGNRELHKVCVLNSATAGLLEQATRVLGLSARAHHRILKLARTIADLADQREVQLEHVSEAIALRALDRRQRLYPTTLAADAARARSKKSA